MHTTCWLTGDPLLSYQLRLLMWSSAVHSLHSGGWRPAYLLPSVLTESHVDAQRHFANLFTSVGCFAAVSRDNPLTASRCPALTHQCNDLAANHRLCNIHEWKQSRWFRKVFRWEKTDIMLLLSYFFVLFCFFQIKHYCVFMWCLAFLCT